MSVETPSSRMNHPLTTTRRFVATASETTTTTSLASSRLVVSRRAWDSFKDKIPHKPPPVVKPKADEKPWPQSVRIAGYVAGGLLVPYISIWCITSNPTLRRWFGPYLPMDKFRSHFGQLEWNVQSYVDEMQLDLASMVGSGDAIPVEKPQPNVQYYQFPEELPFRDRQQQEIIDAVNESSIKVQITLFSSSSSQDTKTQTIPAKTLATAANVIAAIQGSDSTSLNTNEAPITVAVHFEDDDDMDDTKNESNDVFLSDDDAAGTAITATDAFETANNNDNNNYYNKKNNSKEAESLLKETQTFSKWFYISPQQQAADSNMSSSSDRDMAISRLEFTIAELRKSLKDPTCTRDMDEMAAELRQAKRELSGLKWKRRLGLA
ncbi:hypothetical protein IV203_017200 [Nitzschia inconspicua]|uniref:Uncharacterized protein n=1 Tax=Nitzschia inconspicua TaxID=303405 RepID=A0A9K3KSN7_9STRA|nr:hypothetical protein IV203_017200 [Nitzschia inconspicua]